MIFLNTIEIHVCALYSVLKVGFVQSFLKISRFKHSERRFITESVECHHILVYNMAVKLSHRIEVFTIIVKRHMNGIL